VVRTLRYFSGSSRIRPVPRTTQVIGFLVQVDRQARLLLQQHVEAADQRAPAGHHDSRSTMSDASSGGVISRARRTASTICWIGSCTASRISLECTRTIFGMPETRSPALHFHFPLLPDRCGRSDLDLDLLGRGLADEEVVVLAHELHDGLV